MLSVDERDGGASTSAVSRLIDNCLAIKPVQQVHRAVLSHQPVYGHLGAGSSAGFILGYCVASSEPAAEQCYPVATRDVGERGTDVPPMNEKGHGLAADVDIHALALEFEGGELASLPMFAKHFDGDVFGHLTPPAWFQSNGLQRPPPGRC